MFNLNKQPVVRVISIDAYGILVSDPMSTADTLEVFFGQVDDEASLNDPDNYATFPKTDVVTVLEEEEAA